MVTADFALEFETYEGPLDLLLYLIRREELSIFDFPIKTITNQFIEFLELLELLNLDEAGQFVLMASTLMEIKSREALPRPEEEPEPEEFIEDPSQPSSALVQKLLEYNRYKSAADALVLQAATWRDRFPRLADDRPTVSHDPTQDYLKDLELWDLVSAFGRIVRHQGVESRKLAKQDDTPIHIYVDQLGVKIRQNGRTKFQSFFEQETPRGQVIGMFLAILELVRHHGFFAQQELDGGEIWLLPPEATLEENHQPVQVEDIPPPSELGDSPTA